ncbi:MAG: CBS domain-containing protein [Janthinobacterium lividum]
MTRIFERDHTGRTCREWRNYNQTMRGWSLSLGKYFGVELRLHALTVLLLPVMVMVSSAVSDAGFRGIALWLLLVAAVLVREIGRTVASAAAGLQVTRLVLLPTGAAPQTSESGPPLAEGTERLLALAGPLANFFAGLTMALLMYSATSHINLFERPWFGPSHLLRSAIWAQVLLGGLNLLPALPLDAGLVLRQQFRRVQGAGPGARASAGVSQGIALVLVVLGAAMQNTWMVIMGLSLLLTGRAEAVNALASSAAEQIAVSEVMLREFSTVAASDTLEDALRSSVSSLQDVFPVVRGPLLVGAVSRETLLNALRTDPNSYVQSVMTRTIEVVAPDDPLIPALQRVQASQGAQLVPVVADDRIIGILTPGNLSRSMAVLGRTKRILSLAGRRG